MSKPAKALQKTMGKAKPSLEKVVHGIYMKTIIPAGLASAAPPLGTMLGQRGINIANFVKDFNERTKNIKEGVPLMTRVRVQGDRSYILEICKPPLPYLLLQAAGIKRGSMLPGNQVAGVVSLKHIYEIAKYNIDDIHFAHLTMQQMCIRVINMANQCGIKIIKEDLNPDELAEFLEKRVKIDEEEIKAIAEKKAAKLMRAANMAAAAAAATTAAVDKKK